MSGPRHWVFLRGLMRDSRHWGSFPLSFQAAFPDDRIELLDLPGNGSRNSENSPATVEAMSEFCRRRLHEAGLSPPHHILAMSLGAMVTVDWMTRHPDEVRAAVLINTSLRPFSHIHQRLRPAAWLPLLRLLLGHPDDRTIEQTILELTSRHRDKTGQVVDEWVNWRRHNPVSRANALRQLIAAARFNASRRPPAMPVLILNGAQDGLVDPRCSQKLAKAWQCPIAIHPSAGHDLPLDDGDWVIAQVKSWREQNPGI
jgi:pimeloyl-ACP methyl ester carboxylesterase